MRKAVAAAMILVASAAGAATQQFTIANDGKSYAGFRIDDTVETVDGDTRKVSGAIRLDADNLPDSSVEMSVDLPSLDTGISLRDSEMRSTLGTTTFPLATFRSVTIAGAPAALPVGQAADFRVGGDFTLHGVTHRISAQVRLTRDSATRLHATGRFTIRMTDYGIEVPDKLVVSVANEVAVRFDVFATAR